MTNKINKISELWALIDEDNEEHILKNVAKLFLAAYNDWPDDISNIDNFITAIKEYFGLLTIDNISSKKFDGNNAWNIEAGSSIIEMIRLSNEHYNQFEFDKIIDNILDYYSKKNEGA